MPDNKGINRSSNDHRALGLGIYWQIYVNTTNAVILYVIRLNQLSDASYMAAGVADKPLTTKNCCSMDWRK